MFNNRPEAEIRGCSGDQLRDDLAGDVGQAEVAPLEAVGEPRVVDAEQVEDRGVEVVDVDRVLDDVPAEVVGLADDLAPLDRRRRPSRG